MGYRMEGMFERLSEKLEHTSSSLAPSKNAELRELLRQIDRMVCRKRDDWQLQFDKMSENLKSRDRQLQNTEQKLAEANSMLSKTQLKLAQYDSGKKEVIRSYETQISSLREKLRDNGVSPE